METETLPSSSITAVVPHPFRFFATATFQVDERTVNSGDEVPEANGWRDVGPWIASGKIMAIPTSMQESQEVTALRATVDQLLSRITALEANTHTHNKSTGGKT